MTRILVTCPPMLGMIRHFETLASLHNIKITAPSVRQTLTEEELMQLVPKHDGWIIGDDPATRDVFQAGSNGRLRAAVKWGIGTDNVDFAACEDFGIEITNTPNMFGEEVADVAMGYVIALARQTFEIDRGVREGEWPKPCGISLSGKTAALVGFGNIGRSTARRLMASMMKVIAYDPAPRVRTIPESIEFANWPARIEEADFIILNCALTEANKRMVNKDVLNRAKKGVRIVNVGRGLLIDENALEAALIEGKVYSAALDVFELEPLPLDSPLRNHPRCIFGSHNSSNTYEAVLRTSELALKKLVDFLSASA